MIDQITGNVGEYFAVYLVLGCTFTLGWIVGALVTRSRLEEQFGRLLADICEQDAGLIPGGYPKDAVDREWEQLMRDRLS